MATEYRPDARGPHFLEQNSDTTIEMPIYSGASLAVPSSGTITVLDGSNDRVVDGAAVTITSGVATYTVPSTVTTTTVSDDWWTVWNLTMPARDIAVRNHTILCMYLPQSTVSNRAILRREPTFTAYPRTQTSWEPQIEDVRYGTMVRLLEEGRQPHKITSPYSLHEYQLSVALANVAELQAAFSVGGADRYSQKAEMYRERAEHLWGSARFRYDTDEDGDTDVTGTPAQGVIYTSMPAMPWHRYNVRRLGDEG